jgi:hypothetical protein
MTGRDLAAVADWHSSKVSKIEYGKQTPSEDDIRAWCEYTGAHRQIADLIATVRHIESMYVELRRSLGAGINRRQRVFGRREADTSLMRWYEPLLIPGLLHTAEYAAAIMRQVIDFYGAPDDLDAGVAARMERQQILYRGNRRFHFIVAQQALSTMVGDPQIMIGQLDRLLAVMSIPRVGLGIVPVDAPYVVPTNQFIMFDDELVHLETVSAEVNVTQPREITLYSKAFAALADQSVTGTAARALIAAALDQWRDHTEQQDD